MAVLCIYMLNNDFQIRSSAAEHLLQNQQSTGTFILRMYQWQVDVDSPKEERTGNLTHPQSSFRSVKNWELINSL